MRGGDETGEEIYVSGAVEVKLRLISDFNLGTLENCLANDAPFPLALSSAPFGQVMPGLLAGPPGPTDFALVWTLPEKVLSSFAAALEGRAIDEAQLFGEIHDFCEGLRAARKQYRAIFVASWTLPHYWRGNGILSLGRQGLRRLLIKSNLRLAEELEENTGIYLLDAQPWIEAAGKDAYSPKLWYLAKTPFHAEVFRRAACDVRAAISAVTGGPRKLLIVDLDNTLWGGVVGDAGWQDLRIGGHDYLGEAFLDFQRGLQALRRRGILLAIVSKNDESVAMEAIGSHPEMVLRVQDFIGWRINWKDKAANIAELAAELKLGLESIVFIDDNPVERARVGEALPEVLVPEWPDDKTLSASRLLELDCFDSAYPAPEDASRHELYAAGKQREQSRPVKSSEEEWLLSLGTEATVEAVDESNRLRVIQLLNKTNQMNLATRRLTESELQSWLQSAERAMWAFRMKDRFGDSGIIGIVSVETDGDVARVSDFVLSCRVMGRKLESAMLAFAAEWAAARGCREVQLNYVPTPRNAPCMTFLMAAGLKRAQNTFTWPLTEMYPFPQAIRVEGRNMIGQLTPVSKADTPLPVAAAG